MAGWLETVQRDPRSMGAFRRRIESLLTDPAVARRIAGRLDRRGAEGGAAPATDRRPATGCMGAVLGGAMAGRTIFGRCDCDGNCCLMVPDLRRFAANHAPPVLQAASARH